MYPLVPTMLRSNSSLPLSVLLALGLAASARPFSALGATDPLKSGKVEFRVEDVPGSKVRRGISRGVLEAPIARAFEVITDYGHFAEFMPKTKVAEIRETRPDGLRYYSFLDMPWPVHDVSYECDAVFAPDRRSLTFNLVPGTGKGVKGFNGSWTLSEYEGDPGKTLAEYSLFFEADRWYPPWAVKLGTKHTMGGIMDAIRKRLKETGRKEVTPR